MLGPSVTIKCQNHVRFDSPLFGSFPVNVTSSFASKLKPLYPSIIPSRLQMTKKQLIPQQVKWTDGKDLGASSSVATTSVQSVQQRVSKQKEKTTNPTFADFILQNLRYICIDILRTEIPDINYIFAVIVNLFFNL